MEDAAGQGQSARQEDRDIAVVAILEEALTFVRRSDEEGWSQSRSTAAIVDEVIDLRHRASSGDPSARWPLQMLFAPTGVFQELAMANGWHDEYMALANRFDHAIEPELKPEQRVEIWTRLGKRLRTRRS